MHPTTFFRQHNPEPKFPDTLAHAYNHVPPASPTYRQQVASIREQVGLQLAAALHLQARQPQGLREPLHGGR
jgi:hypothetical protein